MPFICRETVTRSMKWTFKEVSFNSFVFEEWKFFKIIHFHLIDVLSITPPACRSFSSPIFFFLIQSPRSFLPSFLPAPSLVPVFLSLQPLCSSLSDYRGHGNTRGRKAPFFLPSRSPWGFLHFAPFRRVSIHSDIRPKDILLECKRDETF